MSAVIDNRCPSERKCADGALSHWREHRWLHRRRKGQASLVIGCRLSRCRLLAGSTMDSKEAPRQQKRDTILACFTEELNWLTLAHLPSFLFPLFWFVER